MTAPKYSVLIATRHRPEWLAQAVASVVGQTVGLRDVEIVVVHDGQPGTGPPRVGPSEGPPFDRPDWDPGRCIYMEQQHAGRSAAINKAFGFSGGQYVTVLDDDDLMHPGKLELLGRALDTLDHIDVAYGLPCYVDAFGLKTVVTPPAVTAFLREHPVITWQSFVRDRTWMVHSTVSLYRRTVWERAGLWDVELPTCEEWEYNMRCLHHGARFYGVDAVTDYYRIHSGQKSGRKHRQLATRHAVKETINERIGQWIKETV